MGLFFNRSKQTSSNPLPSRSVSKARPYGGELYLVTEIPASTFFKSNSVRLKKVDCYIGCYTAIDESDNLWCWGNEDTDGQGFMRNGKSTMPAKILDNVEKVYTSKAQALRKDGSLWEWDGNLYRPNWNDAGHIQSGGHYWRLVASDVADISGRLRVDTFGNVYGSGHNYGYTLDPSIDEEKIITEPKLVMRGARAAKDFSVGYNIGVLKKDNSLWIWGTSYEGQVGNGSTEDQLSPYRVLTDVKDFFYSRGTVAAIRNDGTLWSWGENKDGKVGNGSVKDQLTPVKTLDDVIAFEYDDIGVSPYHGALRSDHSLWMWGKNVGGMFMREPNTSGTETYTSPTKIMDNVKEAVSFGIHMAAVKTDGSLVIWGGFGINDDDRSFASNRLSPQIVLSNVAHVGEVWGSACFAVKEDGSIWYILDKSHI